MTLDDCVRHLLARDVTDAYDADKYELLLFNVEDTFFVFGFDV